MSEIIQLMYKFSIKVFNFFSLIKRSKIIGKGLICNLKIPVFITIITSYLLISPSFAAVSVEDFYQENNEALAVGYVNSIYSIITQLGDFSDSEAVVAELNDLIDQENKLSHLCQSGCSGVTQDSLIDKLQNLNDSLTNNFNHFAGLIDNSVTNIKQIQSLLSNSGVGSTGYRKLQIAVAEAAAAAQHKNSNILLQIQALLVNRQLAENAQKVIAKTKAQAIYTGFGHNDL